MAFWIQNNVNLSSKWRIIHNILYAIWGISMILRFIAKIRDKSQHIESDLQTVSWIVWVSSGFMLLLLSFIHWLKPKLFEEKA